MISQLLSNKYQTISKISARNSHLRCNLAISYSFSTKTDDIVPRTNPKPPSSLNKDMAVGILDATKLFMNHGLGKQRLTEISKEAGDSRTLVTRWQKMMEAYLGTQVHVLAGLGYDPSESGLHLYNQHLAIFLQSADPDTQEKLRTENRDIWRGTLCSAFGIPSSEIDSFKMTIVDARNVMHKVSQKMIEPEILEKLSLKCSTLKPSGNKTMDIAQKHQLIQETLVHDVYLGGNPSLVSECGFQSGEKGYVLLQCVMSEYQSDPLVAQYVGTSMMQLMQAAGIDLSDMQKLAEEIKNSK